MWTWDTYRCITIVIVQSQIYCDLGKITPKWKVCIFSPSRKSFVEYKGPSFISGKSGKLFMGWHGNYKGWQNWSKHHCMVSVDSMNALPTYTLYCCRFVVISNYQKRQSIIVIHSVLKYIQYSFRNCSCDDPQLNFIKINYNNISVRDEHKFAFMSVARVWKLREMGEGLRNCVILICMATN